MAAGGVTGSGRGTRDLAGRKRLDDDVGFVVIGCRMSPHSISVSNGGNDSPQRARPLHFRHTVAGRARVRTRVSRLTRLLSMAAVAATVLTACASVLDGTGTLNAASNADLTVIGDSHSAFDVTTKNALSDVFAFWKTAYPKVSGGKALPPIKGGLYSVDGDAVVQDGKVSGPAAKEGCLARKPGDIVDNAFFCGVDDSIVWDRAPQHLVAQLDRKYGPLVVALTFAHEFGHAVQDRLGIFDQNLPTIATESQADCAAGAFMAAVLHNQAPHFSATPDKLDEALNGFLQLRDAPPVSSREISHGNGFDRLASIDDGLTKGVTFCYGSDYFNRTFTERPYVSDSDYKAGGNETLEQVLDPNDPAKDPNAGGLQPDLNRFWKDAAASINKSWKDVKIAQADHPKCGAAKGSEFGYCPDDNTVYYSKDYAKAAYNSLADNTTDDSTGDVTLLFDQPADFALGTLFAIGWGMAVRHQLFGGSVEDRGALTAAVCYSGAYAKDINLPQGDSTHQFILSPPDMDEATSAVLNLVGQDTSFGARGMTGLQRIQAFVKGYRGGLSTC
jgi:predicted metalloprotease